MNAEIPIINSSIQKMSKEEEVRIALVSSPEAFQKVMSVRRQVFVEEQHIDASSEFDENDSTFSEQLNSSLYRDDVQQTNSMMRYYLAELVPINHDGHDDGGGHDDESNLSRSSSKIGGTCRVRKTGPNAWKMERFAVLKDLRGFGIGRKLLRFVLLDLSTRNQEQQQQESKPPKIYLHAQLSAVPFYQKCIFQEERLKGRFLIVGEPFEEAFIPHCKMEWQWE